MNQRAIIKYRWEWLYAIGIVLLHVIIVAAQAQPSVETTVTSSADEISDSVLFEDLKNPAAKYYLPRYRLAVQTVSGDLQYRVRFYKQGAGTNLEVYLEKYPAQELGDAARNAQELAHQIRVLLRCAVADSNRSQKSEYRELVFQETSLTGSGLKAILRLENLQDRDSLIRTIEDPKLDTSLLIQRMFALRHRPKNRILALEKEANDKRFSYAHAGRAGVVIPKEDWAKLEELEQYIKELKTNGVPVTVNLDNIDSRRPFSFDHDLHSYVFAGIIVTPGGVAQLVREQVSWQSVYHSYFRPADRTDRWYYLPDRFVLARQNQLPNLKVQFTGPPESQTVELEYAAIPSADPSRLEAAKAALQLGTSDIISLEPLVAKDAALWLSLPGSGDNGPYQQRPGASVDLRAGLKDQVRLTLKEFQKIYAALFNVSHTLLTGEVRLNPDGVTQERIPFEARVTELSPEAFWDKAISPLVFADYQRTIQVKTSASVFSKEVKTLIVVFRECDDDVELFRDNLEAQVVLRMPMRDYILNSERGGEYHYKVTAVRERDGKILTTKMPSWRAGNGTILYPEVP